MSNLIVTLTGPSCAGKSTLESLLKKRGFVNVVSTTTRPPRLGEVQGKNYDFVSKEWFLSLESNGRLIESVYFNGYFYGVTETEIERVFREDKPVVIVVEPSGQEQIKQFAKKKNWQVYSIFVTNPALIIAQRFLERVITDFEFAENKGTVLLAQSSRLAAMLTEERHWIANAGKEGRYDLFMGQFDEMNSESVVDEIIKRARLREAA